MQQKPSKTGPKTAEKDRKRAETDTNPVFSTPEANRPGPGKWLHRPKKVKYGNLYGQIFKFWPEARNFSP